jgi:hypothetical protein
MTLDEWKAKTIRGILRTDTEFWKRRAVLAVQLMSERRFLAMRQNNQAMAERGLAIAESNLEERRERVLRQRAELDNATREIEERNRHASLAIQQALSHSEAYSDR